MIKNLTLAIAAEHFPKIQYPKKLRNIRDLTIVHCSRIFLGSIFSEITFPKNLPNYDKDLSTNVLCIRTFFF